MSFKHGSDAELWLGSADLSAFFNDMGFAADVDTAETTTFKKTWKTHIPGAAGAKLDTKGLYDPDQMALPALLQAAGGAVLTAGPAGLVAIGDLARLLQVDVVTYAEASPVGGVVGFTCAFSADGTVGFGYALHPLAEDTNTTTGADQDDAAATTTGWTAHLHVTAVDGGSWVVKLQDAATTDWTDVTGEAFTAATAGSSQRLVGASGATLRRHVRYVATRTGGSAGNGITFGLAVARN